MQTTYSKLMSVSKYGTCVYAARSAAVFQNAQKQLQMMSLKFRLFTHGSVDYSNKDMIIECYDVCIFVSD